jgi:molybdopterin biosynthesis enzyme
MTRLIKKLVAVAADVVLATGAVARGARADQIEHHIAKVDGIRFHYVTAGTGDPVLLLPGWPESWIANFSSCEAMAAHSVWRGQNWFDIMMKSAR